MHFSGSYHPHDVQILLKPSIIPHVDVNVKEHLIQSGTKHYSEMLSPENIPDERYLALYRDALKRNAGRLRSDVDLLAESIIARAETSSCCVVISLARAGTPIGVLLHRALVRKGADSHHYSVSIIRGRGIDPNALKYIKNRHGVETSIFLDGWTGKGAIKDELNKSLAGSGLGYKPFLAVIADPAGRADLAATTEDYVIPSGLLNGIVSGLISRSVLTDELVGPDDFHACLFQKQHREEDLSQSFIDAIEHAPLNPRPSNWTRDAGQSARVSSVMLVKDLMAACNIIDINRIKPGIAEATRALLRRVPDRVYIADKSDPEIQHILHLADQSGVQVIQRDLHNYRAVTIIKKLGMDQE